MSSRAARVARGFAAAGVATFVATLFHVAGGGQTPSVVALILSLVFSSLACVALAGTRLALWRLALSVLFSQFLFHALFALTPSSSFDGMPADGHLHAGMHLTLVPGAGAAAHPSLMAGDTGMWIAHASAALLTIAALHRGERTFRAVCRFAFFRLRQLAALVASARPPVGARGCAIASAPFTLPSTGAVLGGMRHRGPPVGVVPVG